MKIVDKNSEQSCDSKPETFLTSGFKFCSRVFRFSLLACCLLAFLAGKGISSEQLGPIDFPVPHSAETSQDANMPDAGGMSFIAPVYQELLQSSFLVGGDPNSDLGHRLWQARISSPEDEKDCIGKNELKRIIGQIRSIRFEPEKQAPEPVIAVEPLPTIEPNETLPLTEAPNQPAETEIKFKKPYESVSDKTLRILADLSKHPDRLENPLKLAEVLFLSGNTKEATVFYQEALGRKGTDDARSAQDRAWILFQIGNCLRTDDPPTAKRMYRQLIGEYPDSPWVDLAKAQDKLIDWYQTDKPRTLIEEPVL